MTCYLQQKHSVKLLLPPEVTNHTLATRYTQANTEKGKEEINSHLSPLTITLTVTDISKAEVI